MLTDTDLAARRLVIAGCLLTILGSKIVLIATYGSPTPFWDQWDAEAAMIYRPWLAGTLSLTDLLAKHNEHNLLLSHLTALGLLIVSGRWDPILQMLVNAAFYTGTIGVLIVTLCRAQDRVGTLLLWPFAMVLYAVPFGWENSLFGMLQFYFLILFAPLGLSLLCDSIAFGRRWWAGNVVALLSFFCLASGSLTLLAFVVVAIAQMLLRKRSGRNEIAGIVLQVAVVVFLIWLTPTIKEHQELRAQSFLEWLNALALLAGWPIGLIGRLSSTAWLSAALMFAPTVVLAICVWRERAPLNDPRWFYVALAVWVGWQILAFSYGRSRNAYSTSRYTDIYALGVLVNAACLMRLTLVDLRNGIRLVFPFAVSWVVILFAAGGLKAMNSIQREISWRRDTGEIQTEAVKRYLQSGDAAVLNNKPAFHIPYPTAGRLVELLSDKSIRSILPPVLLSQEDRNTFKQATLKHGPLLIPLGLALMFSGALAAGFRARRELHPNCGGSIEISRPRNLGRAIHERFGALGGIDLPQNPQEAIRQPPDFGE